MSKIRHVYALFETAEAATAAYAEVQSRGCSNEHCSAILHEQHIDESSLPDGERAVGEGARDGALVAGTTGAVIAGLAVLGGGTLGVGPLAAIALGGGVMAAYGALLGGLAGSDVPEQHLRALEKQVEAGKVLVAVETDDEALEKICEEVFEEHGGSPIAF